MIFGNQETLLKFRHRCQRSHHSGNLSMFAQEVVLQMDCSPTPRRYAALIGAKVRSKRIGDGLTEEAVARAMSCDVAYIQAAEQGEISFTAEDLYELCSILRVLPSWFFEDLDGDAARY